MRKDLPVKTVRVMLNKRGFHGSDIDALEPSGVSFGIDTTFELTFMPAAVWESHVILSIGLASGAFAVGAFSTGFFSKAGEELYDWISNKFIRVAEQKPGFSCHVTFTSEDDDKELTIFVHEADKLKIVFKDLGTILAKCDGGNKLYMEYDREKGEFIFGER